MSLYFIIILISFSFPYLCKLHNLDKPSQKKLYGASKIRADELLKIAEEKLIIKTLITEANLKRVGILSERVGTRCEFLKFRNDVLIVSSLVDSDDNESDEEENNSKGKILKGHAKTY